MSDTIHLLCATFNGARWLPEFLESVTAQSHTDWHLWVKDDGSSDDTRRIVGDFAHAHPRRVTLHQHAPHGLGAARSFAWLWNELAADVSYVAFADQDDVWMPHKLERSLAALREAEHGAPGPILVHTDLCVVDAERRVIAPSFARAAGLPFTPRPLREVLVWNVVTGCTVLVNRALRERMGPIPETVPMHDWWVACVAAIVGRTVSLDEPTVWYRQHGANVVGARARARLGSLRQVASASWRALARAPEVREGIADVATLASLLLAHGGATLTESDRALLADCARIPSMPWLARKLALARRFSVPARGTLRNLGIVLRG
ncbi:MAG: glycosyltransferase family 2 protein [Gemmatimonadaceae bacterium]